jgi:AraC-like DNA-binding protein
MRPELGTHALRIEEWRLGVFLSCKILAPASFVANHQVGMTRPEFSKLWQVKALPGVSFFKASFLHHAFSKHAHEEYAIGASESGVETFQCRGGKHWATRGSVILVNPQDLHDGRAVGKGYSYRMLYITPEVFKQTAREDCNSPRSAAPLFQLPMSRDESLAAEIRNFARRAEQHQALDSLTLEVEFLRLVKTLLDRHGGGSGEHIHVRRSNAVIRMACRYLEDHFASNPTLTDVAEYCRVSRFVLMRLFSRHIGMPPHSYLTHVRLRTARQLLLSGVPAASVAASVGYVDQSHLTKRFRAAFGVTPGQFIAALT